MNRNNVTNKFNLRRMASGMEVQNIFSLILIVVFIIFVVYLVYNYVKTSGEVSDESPIIINSELDAFVQRDPVELPQIKSGLAHSISTWIYIKDFNYNYGAPKHILWKGNADYEEGDDVFTSPQIYIYPETNTLGVNTTTTFDGANPEKCDIQNIPLMKWVHIVYVLNNRSVDVYINGKLERSTALRGIPVIRNDPLWITYGEDENSPGFYGKIGKTQYFTYAVTPAEIANIYNDGPMGNTLYKIKLFDNNSFLTFSKNSLVEDSK